MNRRQENICTPVTRLEFLGKLPERDYVSSIAGARLIANVSLRQTFEIRAM